MALQDTDLFIIGRSNTSYNTSFLNLKTGLDSRYLKLSGGTVNGNLTTDGGQFTVKGDGKSITLKKPDTTRVFQISPNGGTDYSTNIYSYNSGAMRFRVTNNDGTSGYKTGLSISWTSHTVGSTTYDAKTEVNFLKTPTNPGHAANKQYVDDQIAAIPTTTANIPIQSTASSNVGDMWFNPNDNTLYIKKS